MQNARLVLLTIAALSLGCGNVLSNETESTPAECPEECDPGAADLGSAECNDSDPETADRCGESGCGVACSHFPAECDASAGPGDQAAQCDDGDPCTAERCFEGACAYSPVGTCP